MNNQKKGLDSKDHQKEVSEILSSALGLSSDSMPADLDGLSEAFKVFSDSTAKMGSMYQKLEERVAELTEELDHKNRELEQANRLASLGELSAGVAHEIRNPLAGIELSATLLKRTLADDKKQHDLVGNIVESVVRINSIVMNLLIFARGQKIETRKADVVAVIQEAVDSAVVGNKEDGAKIELKIEGTFSPIYGDAGQLRQVFINFIQNGIDAMDKKGSMEINVCVAPDNFICVSFKDHGVGMDEETINKIFNPFYTTKEQGTGLGLAISYRIIENHGGRISVDSQKDKGSVFKVFLPLDKG